MKARRLPRTWMLLVLALLAAATPGCQFLQNEFFYLCPTPETRAPQDRYHELSPQQQAP